MLNSVLAHRAHASAGSSPGRSAGCAGEAAVDELHARYVKQLRELWDKYKDRFAIERKGTFRVVE